MCNTQRHLVLSNIAGYMTVSNFLSGTFLLQITPEAYRLCMRWWLLFVLLISLPYTCSVLTFVLTLKLSWLHLHVLVTKSYKICSIFSWKSLYLNFFCSYFTFNHYINMFSLVFFRNLIVCYDIFLQLLKPAFTIIRDTQSKCLLLLIRGTHSIKDTLTAATGAVVPFHHSVLNDGGISNLVLGYAHCGMVAAARWIAKLCTPTLLKALGECPDFNVKVFFLYSIWKNCIILGIEIH